MNAPTIALIVCLTALTLSSCGSTAPQKTTAPERYTGLSGGTPPEKTARITLQSAIVVQAVDGKPTPPQLQQLAASKYGYEITLPPGDHTLRCVVNRDQRVMAGKTWNVSHHFTDKVNYLFTMVYDMYRTGGVASSTLNFTYQAILAQRPRDYPSDMTGGYTTVKTVPYTLSPEMQAVVEKIFKGR